MARRHKRGVSRQKVRPSTNTAYLENDKRASDTIFILQTEGEPPFCGFICCPTQGYYYDLIRDELPNELIGHVGLDEYVQFIDDCNKAYLETTLPSCPCGLTLIFYNLAECILNIQMCRKIKAIVDDFNCRLQSRSLVWHIKQGYIVLKTLDPLKMKTSAGAAIGYIEPIIYSGASTIPLNSGNLAPMGIYSEPFQYQNGYNFQQNSIPQNNLVFVPIGGFPEHEFPPGFVDSQGANQTQDIQLSN